MDLSTFEKTLKDLETNVIIAKQNEAILKKDIASLQNKISAAESMNMSLEKVIAILTQAATTSRDNARTHFEKIITDALQFVSQSKDYEFVIKELTGRAKASYEFYTYSPR